jgi:DNA polymerase I
MMMHVLFWLLDINYEGPEIRLWGIDNNGNRALIIDRSFLPYFYLLLKEDADPESTLEQIESLKKPSIHEIEIVDRRYFGHPVKTLKITCSDPNVIGKYAKEFSKLNDVKTPLEDDLRFSLQYLIDRDVAPCGWHEVEVDEVENDLGVTVDKVYLAKTSPRLTEESEPLNLRILGFSIVCHSEVGSPKAERDPVVIISLATNTGEEKLLVADGLDDKNILKAFIDYINEFDPDVIVSYASNRELWPYLLTRASKHGITLKVDRCGSEPHTSLYGHVSVTGRANVDLYDFAEDMPEVKVKTLENVADFLGVRKKEKRIIIEETEVPAYWKDPKKKPKLLEYAQENTRSIMGIANLTLDFAIQLASLVKLPLDHVGTAAVGFRVENFLIYQAHKLDELVPKRVERPYFPYVGGMVLKPEAGVHENVAVLDFKSMYPNLMISENISPDTYVKPGESEPPSGVNLAPEVKHKFRKEPPGFYKRVLSQLIEVRDEIRKSMRRLDPKSAEYRVLDARQKAIKVITNACYGYTGWIGARWYVKPVAEATAAWGRATIQRTIELAKQVGLKLVYGDTDSIFVIYDSKKVEELSNLIKKELGLEVKPDRIYERVLFTEAKKRYAGLLPDGWLDVVGLEVVRGDWAEVAKEVQEKVLEIILKENSPHKAAKFVKECVERLRSRKMPYSKLIIWKTLTKKLDEYAVRAPHVEAAKKLLESGIELTLGDKIGYVIIKGPGKLGERAKPYVLSSYDEVDIEYYVNNQILPVATRILSLFGITEEQLKPNRSSLTIYFD